MYIYTCQNDSATVYGPSAPECAEILFLYGTALFNNAVAKSSPLGDAAAAESTIATTESATATANTVEVEKAGSVSGLPLTGTFSFLYVFLG